MKFTDRAAAIYCSHDLHVFQGDLAAANLEDASFDFVTAHQLIEHAPEPYTLMKENARVTRPGGFVLIRTPNSESLCRKFFGRYWSANAGPRHRFLFSGHNLKVLAAIHGLECNRTLKPVKPEPILRSRTTSRSTGGDPREKTGSASWPQNRIPAARLTRRGDELFLLFTHMQV